MYKGEARIYSWGAKTTLHEKCRDYRERKKARKRRGGGIGQREDILCKIQKKYVKEK